MHVNGLGICSFISHSAKTALVLDKGLTSNTNIRTNVSQTKAIVCFFSTYMRLLGGILRRSLNQVTWGWGKLRMRGAGITAPSPWETDWVRSPSSKLPITTGKQRHTTQVRRRERKVFLFCHPTCDATRLLLPVLKC